MCIYLNELCKNNDALKWYKMAAEHGCSAAQCNVGTIFCEGDLVAANHEFGLQWWYWAARRGNTHAQCNYATYYLKNSDPEMATFEHFEWLQLSALNQNVDALCNLGNVHLMGHFCSQDHKTAARYWRIAAGQGSTEAQHNLAIEGTLEGEVKWALPRILNPFDEPCEVLTGPLPLPNHRQPPEHYKQTKISHARNSSELYLID